MPRFFLPIQNWKRGQAPENAMGWQRLPRKIRKAESACPPPKWSGHQMEGFVGEVPHKSREPEDSISTEDNPGRRSRPRLSHLSQQKLLEKLLEKETDSPDHSHFQKQLKTDRFRAIEPKPA